MPDCCASPSLAVHRELIGCAGVILDIETCSACGASFVHENIMGMDGNRHDSYFPITSAELAQLPEHASAAEVARGIVGDVMRRHGSSL